MILSQKQEKLFEFVKEAHKDQVRKYSGEPYITHLIAVSDMVVPYMNKYHLIWEVAICHDLFEDTYMKDPNEWMLNEFLFNVGYDGSEVDIVRNAVDDVTDYYTSERFPKHNREKRKKLEAEKLERASYLAQTVKYVDLIDNTQSIVDNDSKFAKIYLEEMSMYLKVMQKGDWDLYVKAVSTLDYSRILLQHKLNLNNDNTNR